MASIIITVFVRPDFISPVIMKAYVSRVRTILNTYYFISWTVKMTPNVVTLFICVANKRFRWWWWNFRTPTSNILLNQCFDSSSHRWWAILPASCSFATRVTPYVITSWIRKTNVRRRRWRGRTFLMAAMFTTYRVTPRFHRRVYTIIRPAHEWWWRWWRWTLLVTVSGIITHLIRHSFDTSFINEAYMWWCRTYLNACTTVRGTVYMTPHLDTSWVCIAHKRFHHGRLL